LSWNLRGGVAVVTGRASGIGRALAHRLATEKMSVALADVDDAELQKTAREIADRTGETKLHVTTHRVDVSDARCMEQFPSEVVQPHERVTLLINNAGVALYGFFEEVTMGDFEWLMGINFGGCGAWRQKFSSASPSPAPRAHRQCLEHLRNHCAVRSIGVLRG
jgi:NAD(P)-dependent dehydrogenase (short-subunit alcohol dehydrogenase family)